MSSSELDSRNIAISMRKSVENLVISSQDAIGQSISQALTFSGVLTQHTNQIGVQENRNVSRSPSPSIRSADIADLIDNDKGSEMAIHVPGRPAADSVSVSSSSDAAAAGAGPRADSAKVGQGQVTSSNTARGADGSVGGTRVKKKSWYNSLYPTYKSKSDDFKRLFKDLPDDERLIVDYSCALQKDILAHGRLYASQNYLCFYANIFGWETSMSLRWKDVTAITKEKTALVIPNAILVCTDSEKSFLTSFSGRDKAYLMLFRVWQNALMDQPFSSQEIWQWVHSCYGEELGFNSDDEGYARDLALPLPAYVPVAPLALDGAEDLVDSSSMDTSGAGAGGASGTDLRDSQRSTRSASQGRDSPPRVANGEAEYTAAEAGDTLPTDMSDSSDSEPDKPSNGGEAEKCLSSHGGKLLLRQQFPFNIDQLFTMIFTNSKFNLELLAARGTTDYVQAPWQPQGGLKCRQVSYTLGLTSGPIGPKEVHVTETQVMNKCSKPGCLYSIDASSENAGIPYADYFTVEAHYCLQRVSEHATDFAFYGHVKYKKSMWPMVKAFLEKNAMSGLEDYGRLLELRLGAEADAGAPAARKRRARPYARAPTDPARPPPSALAPRASVSRTAARAPASRPHAWLAATLVVLLALNATLYYRLYYAHRTTFDIDDLQNRMSSAGGPQAPDWAQLLEQHSARQRGELLAWRDALQRTVTRVAQTEKALRQLLETIRPSLEKAEREAHTGGDTSRHSTDTTRDPGGDTSRHAADTTRDTRRDQRVEL